MLATPPTSAPGSRPGAPEGVCIGAATYAYLPPDAVVERMPDLHVKGKADAVAYVLRELP